MGLFDFLSKRSPGLSIEDTVMALSKGAVLIDVRSKAEYEAGHAPGARPVDPKTHSMPSTATIPWPSVTPPSSSSATTGCAAPWPRRSYGTRAS